MAMLDSGGGRCICVWGEKTLQFVQYGPKREELGKRWEKVEGRGRSETGGDRVSNAEWESRGDRLAGIGGDRVSKGAERAIAPWQRSRGSYVSYWSNRNILQEPQDLATQQVNPGRSP